MAKSASKAKLDWLREQLSAHISIRGTDCTPVFGADVAVHAEVVNTVRPYDNDTTGYHRPDGVLKVPFLHPVDPHEGMGLFNLPHRKRIISHAHHNVKKQAYAEVAAIKTEEIDAYIASLKGQKPGEQDLPAHAAAVTADIAQRLENVVTTDIYDAIALRLQLARLYFEQAHWSYTGQEDVRDRFYQAGLRLAEEFFGPNPVDYANREYVTMPSLGHKRDFMDHELSETLRALETLRIMAGQQDALRFGELWLADDKEGLKLYDGDTGRYKAPRQLVLALIDDLRAHHPGLNEHLRIMGTMNWDIPPKPKEAEPAHA